MNKIIDIHGHYVFGVDDGAETLPMALDMIHSACVQGATDIVCTSHDSAFIPAYRKNMALLQEKLVTFIGSDAHRTVNLASGVQYIRETCDEDYAADVCWRNAERLLLEFDAIF